MSRFSAVLSKAAPISDIDLFEYGFMNFWQARWQNHDVAKKLADRSKTSNTGPEVWITHSNGAAIAYLATTKYGATPDMIVNINPALDRNLSAKAKFIDVICSEGDRAVYWSRFIPFHLWGDQGKVGYKGIRDGVSNCFANKIPGRMSYRHHCGLFESIRITDWAYYVTNRIYERVGL